jgi:hypothetical protein
MSEPEILPTMAVPIQQACREFPLVAMDIIKRCGLHVEEFNELHEKMQSSFFFGRKVRKEIGKLQHQVV